MACCRLERSMSVVGNFDCGKWIRKVRVAFGIVLCMLFAAQTSKGQTDVDNILWLGRNALGLDDNVAAIRYFNQAIEAKPFLFRPYYYRAYAKFSLEDFRGAEADLDQSIRLNPYIVESYQLRGLCRVRNGEYGLAIDDYSRVLRELPDDQAAWFNRTLCRMELKEYDQAGKDADNILEKWPKMWRAYMLRSQIELEKKDTARALSWMDTLVKLNPAQADAWSFKGRYALQHEEYALADSFLTKSLELRPINYEDLLSRAIARHAMNKFGLAIKDYDKTIELVPNHFAAHYNRGLLLALTGDDNKAIKDFDFVIKKDPGNTLAIYNRAMLRAQTGDYRGAISDYTRLIRAYPGFLAGHAERARLRRIVGDTRGALNDETVLARAGLDLTFGKKRRQLVRKVRRPGDKNWDNYDQPVSAEAENDDTPTSAFEKLFADDLFGKVQNREVTFSPLRPFALTYKSLTPDAKGYHSVGFMPELSSLRNAPSKLSLAGESLAADADLADKVEKGVSALMQAGANAESLLLESIKNSDAYDYATACELLDSALQYTASESVATLLAIQKSALAVDLNKLSSKDENGMNEPSQGKPTANSAMPEVRLEGGREVGTKAGHMQQLKSALVLVDGIVAKNKSNQYIYYNKGCLQLALGDASAAAESFKQSLAIDPRFPEAKYNLGLALHALGKIDEAEAALSDAGELGIYDAYSLLKQIREEKENKKK